MKTSGTSQQSECNPIGALQGLVVQKEWRMPKYTVTLESGPAHCKEFTMTCSVEKFVEIGSGTSKKLAKRNAAAKMLARLHDVPVDLRTSNDADTEVNPFNVCRPVEPAGTYVLVLGLDGAGKSSLLQCWVTGSLEQDTQPTQGLNAVSVNIRQLHWEFLEIGGKEELRPSWQSYMSRALALVFVVDSSDPQLFPLAKRHLHELLASDPRLPLMVLANKQDLPGACSITSGSPV